MNKLRNQRKDVRRTLKTMKVQQYKGHADNQLMKSLNKNSSKDLNNYTISCARKDKSQELKRNSQNHRYGERVTTQNEAYLSNPYYSKKFMSVQLKNHKNTQSNSNEKTLKNNTQIIRKRLSSYLTKPPKNISQNNQRLKTYHSQIQPHRPLVQLTNKNTIHLYPQDTQIEQNCCEAENLFSLGKFEQSRIILQRLLKENNRHRKSLYLAGINSLSQKNYGKCLSYLNILLQLDPIYNKSAWLACSMCYLYLNKLQEGMLRINKCLSFFPDYFEAHLQKGKICFKQLNYEAAIRSLRIGLKLQINLEGNILLAQCYLKTGQHQSALAIYNRIIKQNNFQEHDFLIQKAQCEKHLKKYNEEIQTLYLYLKMAEGKQRGNFTQIHYEIGLSYFIIKDYTNSVMSLEEVLIEKHSKYSTEAIILLTVIHINRRDYYQAYHTLLRKDHMKVEQKKIQFYEKFCEGVINLMKRKFETGLSKLLEIQKEVKNSSKDFFKESIKSIYPMYLSYAYFCLGKMKQCKNQIETSLETKSPQIKLYEKSLQFNLFLCNGLIEYQNSQFQKSSYYFLQSIQIYPNKPQGYLYLAGSLLKIFLKNSSNNSTSINQIKETLERCTTNLKQLNNNYAASAYYFKACVSAYLNQWEEAIDQIDESIERGQDNDAKAFYLRALILACCQNFKQAISDISISISINQKQPDHYLLRSKCLQIEGDGNRAFADLQIYIGLKPDDNEIHKFAGHLLFQNGAFEDAVQAYQNGQIQYNLQNYHVFLTRAKTYFLLGQYKKSVEDMQVVYSLKIQDKQIKFDLEVIKQIDQLFDFIKDKDKKLSLNKGSSFKKKLDELSQHDNSQIYLGKIFREIQISVLKALVSFCCGDYRDALKLFKDSIRLKKQCFGGEEDFEEQQRDREYFINQMNYNRFLCYLSLGEENAAIKCLDLCRIQEESKLQHKRCQMTQFILSQKNSSKQEKSFELFGQKNKMSKQLKFQKISLVNQKVIKLRLCIPFPKVEPPQINPKFDLKFLEDIDLMKIQKKPEAPWILRQQNSIKFTQKIQSFSRLDLNESELSKQQNKQQMGNGDISVDDKYSFSDQESVRNLKQKLKLDDKIEQKLNRLMVRHPQIV